MSNFITSYYNMNETDAKRQRAFESKSLREALAAEEYWYAWKKQQQEEKADVDELYHHIFDYGFSKYDSPQVTAHSTFPGTIEISDDFSDWKQNLEERKMPTRMHHSNDVKAKKRRKKISEIIKERHHISNSKKRKRKQLKKVS